MSLLRRLARSPPSVVHQIVFQVCRRLSFHLLNLSLAGSSSLARPIMLYFSTIDSRCRRVEAQLSTTWLSTSLSSPSLTLDSRGSAEAGIGTATLGSWLSTRKACRAKLKEYSWFSTSRNAAGADLRPLVKALPS